ncbi:Methyltransferase domain-containing protein [Burkholderia sp. D7]|nr:Methyltransferase domain-containing protein [Burkholderia sp. D7]
MSGLSTAESYLHDFHQRVVGSTTAAFASLPTTTNGVTHRSSYDLLASLIPAGPKPVRVLDVGCGDGHLLGLLAERKQPGLRLIGVDMSQGELDAAKLLLPLCAWCRHYPGAATGRPACSFTQPYQPSPIWQSGRPAHRPFRGLLSVHSRYGLHTRAVTVFRDTLHRRLQPLRYLHDCSGCFRLERLPGGACTRWESAAFARRTP